MQICGQDVNIENLKAKTEELGKLMEDPDVLGAIEGKVNEALAELESFEPEEVPKLPNLQEALAELNDKLSSEEFAEKLQKIKADFGEAVDDLDEILEKVNPKINEFLAELPDAKDIAEFNKKLAEGIGGIGGALDEGFQKLGAKIAEANLKLQQKLEAQGTPTIDSEAICKDVPNIDVEIQKVDVKEVKTEIINGVETKKEVTVVKEVPKKVVLPPEPVIPKELPVKSEPKPVQEAPITDKRITAKKAFLFARTDALNSIRADLKKTETDRNVLRSKTYAHVFWFNVEISKIFGLGIEERTRLVPAKFRSLEQAEQYVPESERTKLFNMTKKLYAGDPIAKDISFEDAVKRTYSVRPPK
jgi:DNA repair exonuclease SbcCD ATPase subunit